jgi:hypothetical protein
LEAYGALVQPGEGGIGPIAVSHLTEAVPTAIRANELWRNQGQCSIAGLPQQTPRSHGGNHHADNLITLWWSSSLTRHLISQPVG